MRWMGSLNIRVGDFEHELGGEFEHKGWRL